MKHSALQQAHDLVAQGDSRAALKLLEANQADPACAVRLRELLIGERRDEEATRLLLTLAAGAGPEAVVSQSILDFREGDLTAAIAACQAALQTEPGLATAHNHVGRALHNAGQTHKAIASFRQATECEDNYPEAWHNLGHALRVTGDMAGAIGAFGKALEQAPGYRQAALNLAGTLYNENRVQEAHELFEGQLERDPLDVDALLGAGLCLQLYGRFEDAAARFRRAVAREPGNALAHLYLGVLMNELMDTEAALVSLEEATRLDPGDIEAWVELAGVFEQTNRLEEATKALLKGFEVEPAHPGLNLETARVERRSGHTAASLKRLMGIDPSQLPARAAQQYWFELGHVLDREGDPDEAVRAFTAGNKLARQSVRSQAMDPEAFGRRCSQLEAWLEAGAKGAFPRPGDPTQDQGADLCFLAGFPRSGTTLIDTTLETHDGVMALEEAATLDFVIQELENRPGGYPAALDDIPTEDVRHLRAIYQQALQQHLGSARPGLVVDKMPLRFLHAGLIARLFPAARLLFVLRHPCDVVLSNFMQQYAVNETNIHFDTLEHCATMYDRIMRLWQSAESILPLQLKYVRYEDLVDDTAASIDGVCEFLGLDAGGVNLDREARLETRERVRTSSYQQVAEPIYQRAAGRWIRYRRHLENLLPRLRPHMERYGYRE
jgi:tetratricopeptide (TPR) repeat protein